MFADMLMVQLQIIAARNAQYRGLPTAEEVYTRDGVLSSEDVARVVSEVPTR